MPPFLRALSGSLVGAALTAALVLQVGGASASSASAAYAGRVGLNTHLVWVSQSDARAAYAEAASGGVGWVREEFPWGVVEPQAGTYAWARTDPMMAAASLAGVNVLGILGYSAPWASSDPSGAGGSKYPPRLASDYARYAAAVVSRYGPGGQFWASRPDLPARPLTAVQIWNEPWGHWFWKPNPSPTAYAHLARTAAAAIRAAKPATTILIAGDVLQVRTDGAIVDWLRNLRAADPGLNTLVDAYSVHPYPYPRTHGPYFERSDPRWDYRRVTLTRQIDSSLPIWITEVGWSTASTSDSVTEAAQAAYVRDAVVRAIGEWGDYVQRVFLYSFDRDSTNLADREGHYGLRRHDGTAKPSWTALKTLLGGSAAAPVVPATPFSVSTAAPRDGTTVSGGFVWEAVPSGAAVERIDFAVDGVRRWTERVTPYRYNGDTGTLGGLAAGSHRLTVTATAADGRVVRSEITVQVLKN